MRALLLVISILFLAACGGKDPMAEVNALIAEGKVPQANVVFKEMVEREQDPNLERKYVQFCFEHKQYRDFARAVSDYIARYPEDVELKNLQFEYYAILAQNAERTKDYAMALEYIVQKLLNVDYADHTKWEARQTTILTKWYQHEKEKDNDTGMRKALATMRNLGFGNLGKDLDPERYADLESKE